MTTAEVKARFPAIAQAVEYVEKWDAPELSLAVAWGWAPAKAVKEYIRAAREAMDERPWDDVPDPWDELLHQMEHPDFARYVAGRMGSM